MTHINYFDTPSKKLQILYEYIWPSFKFENINKNTSEIMKSAINFKIR